MYRRSIERTNMHPSATPLKEPQVGMAEGLLFINATALSIQSDEGRRPFIVSESIIRENVLLYNRGRTKERYPFFSELVRTMNGVMVFLSRSSISLSYVISVTQYMLLIIQ